MSLSGTIQFVGPEDLKKLTNEEKADSLFQSTRSLHNLAEERIVPTLHGQLNLSDHEQSLVATYYLMTLLLRGLSSLADPCHFQMAEIVARTVFELLLDLKALADEPSLAAKFMAFTDVSRFHKADQLANYLSEYPAVDAQPHQHAVRFAFDQQRRQRLEQECIQHWGTDKNDNPKWPEHWTGNNIATRARNAGFKYEEIYRSQFFLQSYFVHAGPAGVQNLSKDALIRLFCIAHGLIQSLFSEATEIMCDRFQLFAGDSKLRNRLKFAKESSGFFAVQRILEQAMLVEEESS